MAKRMYLSTEKEHMKDYATAQSNSKYYEFNGPVYDYGKITQFPLVGKPNGLEKYLPLLPIKDILVSLNGGEGGTPLEKFDNFGQIVGLSNLYVKHEELNPTGCFKDRESVVVVSKAIELGFKKVNVCSSGNAALSTAAYAQKAGIECVCYIPEKTSQGKKNLIKLFGAGIVEIPGFYEQVYRHLADTQPEGWNVTSGMNRFRTEGNKTIAYELCEQVGVPDVVVVPCGNGGNLAGIWKGFTELKLLGKIDRLPQMVAVQIAGAAPLATALAQDKDYVVLGDIEDSVAEGIVAQESYCSPMAVRALKESGGYVLEVNDGEIKKALKTIIKSHSFITEPTSAAAFAALSRLNCPGDARVICVNTGSGMKLLDEILNIVNSD